MNLKFWNLLLASSVIAATGLFIAGSLAQDVVVESASRGLPGLATQPKPTVVAGALSLRRNAKANQELKDAIDTLKDEESSREEMADARDTLTDTLGEEFDRDLKQREDQLHKLEERIADLRDQIDRRRAAKGQIIDLRIELMINEAQGLGFPATWNVRRGSGFGMPTPTAPVAIGTARFPQPAGISLPGQPVAPAAPPAVMAEPASPEAGASSPGVVRGRLRKESY